MVLDGKSWQEYPANAGVPQGSILSPTVFLLYMNDLPDVVCDIALYADDSSLLLKVWSAISSLATSKIDFWTWIWSTRHCGLRQEVAYWFQYWKNLDLTGLITLVLLMWVDGFVLEEKSSFKIPAFKLWSQSSLSIISQAKRGL